MDHPLPVKAIGKWKDREVQSAWLVTKENIHEITEWCGGSRKWLTCGGGHMIAFPIRSGPVDCCVSDAALIGDYVLKYANGFESVAPRCFLEHYEFERGVKPLCIDGHAYRHRARKR